jgi:transcriptional regulator with XRE-family HTH domain
LGYPKTGFKLRRLTSNLILTLERLYAPRNQKLRQHLRDARERLNITQQELANKLDRPQSFVSKFEIGERRLDVMEYVDVCEALSIDPVKFLGQLLSDSTKKKWL